MIPNKCPLIPVKIYNRQTHLIWKINKQNKNRNKINNSVSELFRWKFKMNLKNRITINKHVIRLLILVLLHFYCGPNVMVYIFRYGQNILRPQDVAEYLVLWRIKATRYRFNIIWYQTGRLEFLMSCHSLHCTEIVCQAVKCRRTSVSVWLVRYAWHQCTIHHAHKRCSVQVCFHQYAK